MAHPDDSGREGASGTPRPPQFGLTARAQNDLCCLTSQRIGIVPPSVPSAFCSLYSHSILAKLKLNWSTGTTSLWRLPPVWKLETSRSENVYLRNSCCCLPALRQTRTACLMCSPEAQASATLGDDLLDIIVNWMSCITTLPAPSPAPNPAVPLCVWPQLNESISISPLCVESWDSPSIPS